MRNKNGYTPKELAADIAMTWIKHVVEGKTGDIEQADGSPEFKRQVKGHLIKMHDQMLEKSNLDGLALG